MNTTVIDISPYDYCIGCYPKFHVCITGLCASNTIMPEKLPDGEYLIRHSLCGFKEKLIIKRKPDGLHYKFEALGV